MKPIIRHCRNCEYSNPNWRKDVQCEVKYKLIRGYKQRLAALLCKYYKKAWHWDIIENTVHGHSK